MYVEHSVYIGHTQPMYEKISHYYFCISITHYFTRYYLPFSHSKVVVSHFSRAFSSFVYLPVSHLWLSSWYMRSSVFFFIHRCLPVFHSYVIVMHFSYIFLQSTVIFLSHSRTMVLSIRFSFLLLSLSLSHGDNKQEGKSDAKKSCPRNNNKKWK